MAYVLFIYRMSHTIAHACHMPAHIARKRNKKRHGYNTGSVFLSIFLLRYMKLYVCGYGINMANI